MAVVEHFDRGMIERYLRGYDLAYSRDTDGNFMAKFEYDGAVGGELAMLFAANGNRRDVYSITVGCTRTVPRNAWGKAIAHCNEWNQDKRWPRAHVFIEHPASDAFGYVFLDGHLDLASGVHWELFESWTSIMILTSHEFWRWAHLEKGI
jgi:hypothetical protein